MLRWNIALHPPEVESLPLPALVRLGEERLVAGRVIARAAGSPLYRRLWRLGFGRRPATMQDRNDLRRLPFISGADLLRAQDRWPLGRGACSPVYGWASSSSRGESRKWLPIGKNDFGLILGLLDRMAKVVQAGKKTVVLAVPPLAPRLANALPYFWMLADMLATKLGLEFIIASMAMLGRNDWPEFALRRQPDILFCRPADALILAEHFVRVSSQPGAKPRDLLPGLKTGVFFGEPLDPHRAAIGELYGLEPYDLYFSTEHPNINCECHLHQGIHFWMDTCIPEVIPAEELDREREEAGYRPRAEFLDSAAPGLRGELVVTTFAEALPLVRYRTGDLIQLVDCAPCRCGRTHPRIQVLGRLAAGTTGSGS